MDIAEKIININPKAIDDKLQVVTKNHLIIMCIIFGLTSTFLYTENRKTQMSFISLQDRNFERIIVINERQAILQQETNASIKELKNVTIENGARLQELINKKR